MKWIGQHIWSFISRFRSDVYLENVTESAQDHVVGIDADGKLYKQDVSVGDITGVTAGDALTGGGTSGTVTINHQDTSSQASVDNSGRTYIQDVTLDTYGHVTGLTSATETVTDTNTMGSGFTVSATTDSNATTITQGDDLFFAAGTGITCETTADGTVTITNTVTDTNTQLSTEQVQDIVGAMLVGTETRIGVSYDDTNGRINFVVDDMTADTNTQNTTTLSFVDSSDDVILRNTTGGAGSGTDDIKIVAGSNVTLTHTDADNFTIAATDTNTTYSTMTKTALGLGKLWKNTVQTVAANSVTATASRTYGLQINSDDQLVVNVPWTDTDTDTNTQLSDEQVQDIVGGMVTGNDESGITVTYEDSDGTLDFTVGTLNQNTTGQAGTVATIDGLAPNTATTQATQPNITTMTGFVTGSANELITDDGDGTVTSRSYLTFAQNPSTATLSMKAPQDAADMLRVDVTTAGATTLTTVDSDGGQAANFTIDCDGLMVLDADRNGSISMSDGGTTYATFDTVSSLSSLVMYEAAGASTSDYLKISVAAAGATTITTLDAGGTAGHLTLHADGDTIVKTGDGHVNENFKINVDDNTAFLLSGESGNSSELVMYEMGGDSADDKLSIKVEEHGATTIQTTDGGGANANLQITADGTAELAGTTVKLDSAGAITFERGSNSVVVPDAAGTIQLQGENTGQVVHVNIRDNGSYLFYMFNDDYWYSAGSTTLAILGNSTSPGDISSANSEYQSRVGCYTAIANCTIKKLIFTFYWTSSTVNSADIDFAFSKFTPITDGTAATITMNSITATDCNGSYTEVKPYQKTFTFSGGNASLSAGDSFAFHMRTTGSTSSSQRVLVYGNAVLSLELD